MSYDDRVLYAFIKDNCRRDASSWSVASSVLDEAQTADMTASLTRFFGEHGSIVDGRVRVPIGPVSELANRYDRLPDADLKKPPMIRAIVGDDLFSTRSKFDAVPFFADASVNDIVCAWLEKDFDTMTSVLDGTSGYEGTVKAAQAIARQGSVRWEFHEGDMLRWLRAERPEVFDEVCAEAGWNPNHSPATKAPWWDEEWHGEEYETQAKSPSHSPR